MAVSSRYQKLPRREGIVRQPRNKPPNRDRQVLYLLLNVLSINFNLRLSFEVNQTEQTNAKDHVKPYHLSQGIVTKISFNFST